MGVLLGGFGKQMAGKRVRSLQARMMRVQAQLRRATRDIANMEKMIQTQEKNLKNSLKMAASVFGNVMQAAVTANTYKQQQDIYRQYYEQGVDANGNPTFNLKKDANGNQYTSQDVTNAMTMMQQQNAQQSAATNVINQMMQMSMAQSEQMIDSQIELMRQAQLEPLKDLEDELQTEKDSLESQIQLAQADYEACKEMEKASIKNMTPNYTGQA